MAVALFLGSASHPRTALASPTLQGVGEAAFGYSDNLQSAPDVPVAGLAAKAAGGLLLVRPGLVVASLSARVIHRLVYTYTFDLFLQQASASSSSNQLEYRGFFDLAPGVSLVAGATAVQTNQASALLLVPPGAGAVNAVPAGSGAFVSASGDELLSTDLGPDLRGYEGLTVAAQTPIYGTVAPSTFLASGRVGAERRFRTDAVGGEGRADYSVVDGSLAPDGTPLGTQRQIVGTGVATWRHDWGRAFTSRAEAGAMRVERLDSGRGFWQPAGRASIAYFAQFANAEVDYAHTLTTNLLLGQSLLVDEVRLHGALPLVGRGEVLALASAGYQRGLLLDENAALVAHVDAILADIGVTWQVASSVLLGLRFQHAEQISDARIPPLPLSFVRNTVTLGATFRFPPEREMPRAYRAPQRVDGTDEVRDGGEPAQNGTQPGPGTPR